MSMEKFVSRRIAIAILTAGLAFTANAQVPSSASSAAAPPPIIAPAASSSVAAAPAPPAADDPVAQAIYARMQQMTPIGGGPLPRSEVTLGKAVGDFYAQRHYTAAWTDKTNVDQLLAGLRSMDTDGLNPEDYSLSQLTSLRDGLDPANASPTQKAEFDVLATTTYITSLVQLARGKVDPVSLDATWNFDPVAIDPQQGMSMIQTAIEERSIDQVYAMARPQNTLYTSLRDGLARMRDIAAKGGWPTLTDGPVLKSGMTDARVGALRTRLVAGGYLDPTLASGNTFDSPLTDAVKRFQADQYLDADGSVGASTVAAMNVPVQQRIEQIRVNLERARWLLHELQGTFVVVDIAGYKISFYRDGKPVWRSRVQVGKPYRSTPIFRSQITYITFNPTWTVPPTILKNDILPKVRQNPAYLANNRIRALNGSGQVVPVSSVDWNNPRGITLRQDAGPGNSLGRVVIRFPNSFSVYLHDTPHQEMFALQKRDTSSGCIRVEKPLELVQLLFNDDTKWNRAAIDDRIAAGKTQNVTLPASVPVLLAYWTVDIADDGHIAFKPDVYSRDQPLLQALDRPPPVKLP
ncbi:murein L,D-transpeptidase YcbB/YkuD [Luteibacter rhizovicinus]|uniref:Murein L,D-transpeptidase YcbB/YkuD n=1 Tax=Luteibacter rhizovicinus TaxID=242606 RepID=A0A4V6P436_9GAMM|nr:L,D-transpeptidase family protein [Luteibacter rhizovicinus]TCV93279.1 murein L,D-transpeptidase YcbB/YkuD [Luteibacter rhizovicinus]